MANLCPIFNMNFMIFYGLNLNLSSFVPFSGWVLEREDLLELGNSFKLPIIWGSLLPISIILSIIGNMLIYQLLITLLIISSKTSKIIVKVLLFLREKKCVRDVENHWFYARISIMNQNKFASLEGTKGFFLSQFVAKKYWYQFGLPFIWCIFRLHGSPLCVHSAFCP